MQSFQDCWSRTCTLCPCKTMQFTSRFRRPSPIVCICPSMSIYVHLCPSMSIYVHLCPSMSIYVHLCPSMSIYVHLCPSMSIYVHLSTHPSPTGLAWHLSSQSSVLPVLQTCRHWSKPSKPSKLSETCPSTLWQSSQSFARSLPLTSTPTT